jgi:glycosyltransferase involved in cell wall biosynthesis
MNNNPLISIITPSYNQGDFIENTILSVLEQDYAHIEYILMDGGSTDGSLDIIRKYEKHLTYWQSQPDGGQVAALNAGFKKAKGQILTFLNSDDFLMLGAVSKVVELYREHPQAVGWVGGAYSIAQDGYIIQTRYPQDVSLNGLADWIENYIYQPACFFSADHAKSVGYLNDAYENAFDFNFWMDLAERGDFIPTNEILAVATIHPDAKTQKFMNRMFLETYQIQKAHGFEEIAEKTKVFIEQSKTYTQASSLARLLYTINRRKRHMPDNFVRMPQPPSKKDQLSTE